LPNGIKTVTETDNIALRAQLVSHVVLMLARVDTQRDPEVVIQSPSLTQIFQNSHAIDTEVEMSDKGVVVTQTSTDPMVVQLLQTHAAEVSDMSARGMQAVHQRMGDAGHQHQGGH
jgi:glycine cleavage system regulatory protein